MALTVTSEKVRGFTGQGRDPFNNLVVVRKWTLAGTYATGGHTPTPGKDFGLRYINLIEVVTPFTDGTSFVMPAWNPDTGKLEFAWQTDPADTGGANVAFIEVDATTDLADYAGIVRAYGI